MELIARNTPFHDRSKYSILCLWNYHTKGEQATNPFHSFCFVLENYSTCFNRIDLPNYSTKKELYEKLKIAITMSSVGFDME